MHALQHSVACQLSTAAAAIPSAQARCHCMRGRLLGRTHGRVQDTRSVGTSKRGHTKLTTLPPTQTLKHNTNHTGLPVGHFTQPTGREHRQQYDQHTSTTWRTSYRSHHTRPETSGQRTTQRRKEKTQALGAHKPLDNQQQPKTATVTTDGYSSLPTNSSCQHTRHIETAPLETKTQ